MDNSHTARERRQKVAKENAAVRELRTDAGQIKWLRHQGHTAEREIARLKARIAKEKGDG